MSHTIAILTVVYENYTVLEDFLKSLYKQTNTDYYLLVADASSVKKPISLKGIKGEIVQVPNHGYAAGINRLLKIAQHKGLRNFVVINDDTYFDSHFIDALHARFSKNPRSLFGGKIYYAKGFEYHKDNYKQNEKGNVIWYAGGDVDWKHATTSHRGVDEVDKGQFDSFSKTNFITGCLLCFDEDALHKIGYWNDRYFLYYEDADFCERAKKKNVPLYYDPHITLWHKNAQSTEGSGSRLQNRTQKISRLRYGLTFAPFRTKLHLLKNWLSG